MKQYIVHVRKNRRTSRHLIEAPTCDKAILLAQAEVPGGHVERIDLEDDNSTRIVLLSPQWIARQGRKK